MSPHRPVLLVANNFPPVRGGSAVVYANLARCAAGRIIVLAPRVGYTDGLPVIGWREHDRHANYRVIRVPLLRTVFAAAGRHHQSRFVARVHDLVLRARLSAMLLWIILRLGVRTVCIGELLAGSWMIGLLRVIPGVRTVAYVHGEEITTTDSYDYDHSRSRRALTKADGIVVVSRFTAKAVHALMGRAASGKVTLIENGVDTERFRPGVRSGSLQTLYGLHDCFVFVSVCRLLEKKGIDMAIRAFARVVQQHGNARFLVVGTGPFAQELQALAASLGIAREVIFAGQVADSELVEHYLLGDVFVMPNRELPNGDTEGFGLVFLEANACGLPVIAGRDGGSPDAVHDGINGLVVDGSLPGMVETAMLQLLEDAGLRDRLREGGRSVSAAASWGRKAEAFLSLCERAATPEQGGTPDKVEAA